MKTWRIRIRPLSPWASPWRSDTLFGALCWRWLEMYPADFEGMVERFREDCEPPFLVSDAFPGELLPLPAHVRPEAQPGGDLKKLKAPLYVSEDAFRRIARGEGRLGEEPFSAAFRPFARVQTAIDRRSGTAADGQMFETHCQYLCGGHEFLSVYIRAGEFLDRVVACLRAVALTGFGKKSGSGLGEFDLVGEPEECGWLDEVAGSNAYVALNHFVPAAGDPCEGLWRTHVTYPKFHSNAVGNVFKGAILMLTPGSVFRTSGAPRAWYGSVVPVPRPEMPNAIHYALCFPAPAVWTEPV
jgi:CRISPR-associated protein Csm4